MNSLMQREQDSHDLKETIESLFQFDELGPSETLEADIFEADGWYEPATNEYWLMVGGETLFDTEGCWLDSVKLITRNKDSDIKLKISPASGKEYSVPVTRRSYKEGKEEVTFMISRVVSKVTLVVSDPHAKPVEVDYLRIQGISIAKLSEAQRNGKLLLEKIHRDVGLIQRELDSDISQSKSIIEELTEKKANLQGDLASLKIEEEQAKVKIKALNDQVEQQQDFIDRLNKRLSKGNNEFSELQNKLLTTKEEKDTLEASKDSLNTQLSDLNKEVLSVKSALAEYKKDAALYSEDFSTLKVSVILQNLFYGVALILASLMGWWLVCNMYEGALSLSLAIDEKELPLKAIWPLLVSRLPLIAINFFLLTALSSLVLYLVKIIVKNNEETKKVKQAAYLVREVVTYQNYELSISDKVIFEQRVNAKLRLIQKLLQPECLGQEQQPKEVKGESKSSTELLKALESVIKKYSGTQ